MQQFKKVVLAYSGGVDTSVCIPYLKNEYGISEVVTFVADLGQGEDLESIRQKALDSGASQSIVGNLVNSFVERYAFPAIRANALYLDKYPLSTALARPLIAENLVNTAREINADAVAHGCTGKGNDQVRFDLAINALGPDLKIITPAREWNMSREEAILYGEKFGIPAPVSKKSPYSIDVNLLGRSIEAGIYETPGLLLLIKAHKELESITLNPDVVDFKGIVEKKWGQLVYQGFWFGPLKDSLDAFISSTQTSVNGRVKIRLYKGNAIVIGRMSENNSLYREDLATYSKDDVFNHSLAEGFIYMWGMSNKIWAELNSKTKD